MTYGYEVEYFVTNAEGAVLKAAPRFLPRDGKGILVEARGSYYPSPSDAESSLLDEFKRISRLAHSHGLSLLKLAEHEGETAGFHVHFGDSRQIDMPFWIVLLNRHFCVDIGLAGRRRSQYRMKPYGFEYRSLPATIRPCEVTACLNEAIHVTVP
jgi:hypothetical protein